MKYCAILSLCILFSLNFISCRKEGVTHDKTLHIEGTVRSAYGLEANIPIMLKKDGRFHSSTSSDANGRFSFNFTEVIYYNHRFTLYFAGVDSLTLVAPVPVNTSDFFGTPAQTEITTYPEVWLDFNMRVHLHIKNNTPFDMNDRLDSLYLDQFVSANREHDQMLADQLIGTSIDTTVSYTFPRTHQDFSYKKTKNNIEQYPTFNLNVNRNTADTTIDVFY